MMQGLRGPQGNRMSGSLIKLPVNGQPDTVEEPQRGSGFPPLPAQGQALRGGIADGLWATLVHENRILMAMT